MIKKIIILLVFVICWGYVGVMGAVAIHEILGHGMAYELTGYDFTSFTLKPDGMGHASGSLFNQDSTPTANQEIFTLLAGPVSTYIFALLFFILAIIFRKKFWSAITLVLLGVTNLLDGGPYMLWSSYVNGGNGDFARVLVFLPEYRTLFLILGAIMTVGGLIFSTYFIYKTLFRWFGDISSKRWGILTIIFLVSSLAWLGFDWNQLAPGVNYLPLYLASIVNLLTALYIGIRNPQPKEMPVPQEKWGLALTFAVVIFGVVLFSTLKWFQYGITLS